MTGRILAIYVALAIVVSWLPQAIAINVWGLDNDATRLVFVGVMWSPTLLALLFIGFVPKARDGVRWRLGRAAFLPLGIAVETAIAFVILAVLGGLGLAAAGWFDFHAGGVEVSGGPWLLGQGSQGWPLYILNISVTAIAFSVIGLVAATEEEFAWRGFLQGHLENWCGPRPGILILAAIWWTWHLPGLLAGHNFPQHPYLGALVLFPAQMLGTSLFFGWLAIRAGSFWPAALAHAAVNSVQQGVIDNLQLRTSILTVDLLRTVLISVVGLACWFALRHANSHQPR